MADYIDRQVAIAALREFAESCKGSTEAAIAAALAISVISRLPGPWGSVEDEQQQNEMVHVLRSQDGRRGLKWQDGSYMRTTPHSAAIAGCGCLLQDTGVVKGQMRELLRTTARPAERK